ncbi:MAG: sigma-70 family RNA polymerase sigma factor [Gemmataceae bacterium]
MSSTPLLALLARCRALGRPRSQAPDAELLARFVSRGEADAFEEILERYAPLVWGACRRSAADEADAEDAFQATFLALVRQASRLEGRQALGAWLHTVAVRLARKARARTRRQHTQAALPERTTLSDVADDASSREMLQTVDEEIEQLPPLLREPLILCCLQGRTRDEAAEALGCSVGTIKGRLERGRDLLRRRLQRRGVQLPAAFLMVSLTGGRIRAALWAKTMQAAMYTPPSAIVALAEAALPALTAGKCKMIVAIMLLAASAAGVAGSMLTAKPRETAEPVQQAKAAAEPKKPQTPQVRTDRHGDPLPEGAIARLGTVRWRHGFLIKALAYSPDGKKIAAVTDGLALTLWDAATGKALCRFPNFTQFKRLAFSPDGKMIAAADNPDCYLWDVATGKEVRRLKGHQNVVRGVAFSPDGKQVATGSDDGTVRLWDPATGKEQRRIDCSSGEGCPLAYSPDGKSIASSSMDGTIHFWDPATGKERRRLSGHQKAVFSIAFSREGKRLTSLSADGTLRLWDVAAGRPLRSLLFEEIGVDWAIDFSPDGALLAGGHRDGTIRLWDVAEGMEKRRWQAGARNIRAIAFSPDGKTLASGTIWGIIRLWDVATGRERHPSEDPQGSIDFVRYSANGSSLVSISGDSRLLWWDLATRMPRRQFAWTAKDRGPAALSPDGNTLAVGAESDFKERLWEVRLWDVRTDKPGRLLGKQKGMSGGIAFSPDGRLVACGGEDHLIHVWDASNGKETRQIKDVPTGGMSLCFSPDSKALACGIAGKDRAKPALHLWDVASGKERTRFDVRIQGSPYGTRLAFSPDGRVLAFASGDQNPLLVRLWDTASGKELCRYAGPGDAGPNDRVLALTFSPDGKLVASSAVFHPLFHHGQRASSVHVWEAATGRLLRRFEGHPSFVGSVVFSPDGLTVASGAGDSTILLWDITGRRPDGRWRAQPLTPRELETCWTSLANEDAAKAYDAVWALVAAPEQAVPFLQKHLPPVPRPDAKIVSRLIAELDSDEFVVRQKATDELSKLGDAIAPALRDALQGKPSLEVRRRMQQLLDQTRDWTPQRLRDHRAIQALEHIGTRQAKEVLRALAEGAPEARLTEEAKATLHRLEHAPAPRKN